MNTLKTKLKEHKEAIILAALVSLIVIFPQIYFRLDHRNDGVYQGIELIPDSPWSPRVREVMDGHPNFGSIYYKEGKDNPYLFQPLGSIVVGYTGKLFSLDINNTLLLSRILLTLSAILLAYSFVYLLTRDKWVAISSALLILLADSTLSLYGINQFLDGVSPDPFVRIARPVNPAMIYILLFSFLTSFWQYYRSGKRIYGVVSAVLLGLNFYNYFYSWTYLYAFGGILFLILLAQRKLESARNIAYVFIGSLLVAVPYLINLQNVTRHQNYEHASLSAGVVHTHEPLFVGFSVLVVLALFLWRFPRDDRNKYFFFLALLLAPFITMNQQVFTGKVLQADHYHWFFHKPMAVIVGLIVGFYFIDLRLDKYKKLLAAFIIVGSIAAGTFVQVYSYFYDKREGGQVAIERQKYGPVVDWLARNADKEDVVLANNEISHLTVIYTPLNVFYHRAASYSSLSASKERLLEVLFAFYRLKGIGEQEARETFYKERHYISSNIYGIHYREIYGEYEKIPDEKLEEILALYIESLSTPTDVWLRNALNKYDVGYIVWDRKADPLWNPDKYSYLKKEAEFGDILIYTYNGTI